VRKPHRCPDCAVTMEEGFTPDLTLGGAARSLWQRGEGRKVTLCGMDAGVRVVGVRTMPVSTWRCPRCGLLRSYAFPRTWNEVPEKPGR